MRDGAGEKVFQRCSLIIAAEHQQMLQGRKAGLDGTNKWCSFCVGDEDARPGPGHDLVEFGRTIHRTHRRRDRTDQLAGVVGKGKFGPARQIETDRLSLAHAVLYQNLGQLFDLTEILPVGPGLILANKISLVPEMARL